MDIWESIMLCIIMICLVYLAIRNGVNCKHCREYHRAMQDKRYAQLSWTDGDDYVEDFNKAFDEVFNSVTK